MERLKEKIVSLVILSVRTKHVQKQAIFHPEVTTNACFIRLSGMGHMETH